VLKMVASTYDYDSHSIRDGMMSKGKRLITFSNILTHDTFPLAPILRELVGIGQREMNTPVEIEFAVQMDVPKGTPKCFSALQIRPIAGRDETIHLDPDRIDPANAILISEAALGNGIIKEIADIVYIKPDAFDASKSLHYATQLEEINDRFLKEKKNYILVGPGRWGSSDPWLGIPIRWPQISAARLIVESGLENYRIDPSQGTHFFQNLTSFRVGYFTINPHIGEGTYDIGFLESQPAFWENEHIRHVRFDEPCEIALDGKKSFGVVMKPGNMV